MADREPKRPYEGPYFLFLAAGVGCFVLSFLAMGLAPWTSLKRVIAPVATAGNPYFDENGGRTAIGRGRKTYIREGCWHCHSQFVRPVAGEPFRYGPPSQAWEAMYDVPHTYGTRRVGPDLSREAGRRSDDWHLAHLYNPRWTTPLSVMPGYPWFFEETPEGPKPRGEAKDLVAYLQYLGKSYEKEVRDIVHPRLFKVTGSPPADDVTLARGEDLFAENCSGCHGAGAAGDGRAQAFLLPQAANLVDRYVSASEAYSILNRGVLGSSMPSFREMPERDLWALAIHVARQGEDAKTAALASLDRGHLARGRASFESKCAVCHGAGGAGDGPTAAALNPRPKDFTRRLFRKEYLLSIIEKGIPGTTMPGFGSLPAREKEAVVHYVTSLYREGL